MHIRVLNAVHESERGASEDAGAAGVEDESNLTLPSSSEIEVAVFEAERVGATAVVCPDGASARAPEVSVEGFFLGVGGFGEEVERGRDISLSAKDYGPDEAVIFTCANLVVFIEMVSHDGGPSEIESIFDNFEVHLVADVELVPFIRPIFDVDAFGDVIGRACLIIVLFGMEAHEVDEEVVGFQAKYFEGEIDAKQIKKSVEKAILYNSKQTKIIIDTNKEFGNPPKGKEKTKGQQDIERLASDALLKIEWMFGDNILDLVAKNELAHRIFFDLNS